MLMLVTNRSDLQRSLDIPLADGTQIRELVQPGETRQIREINPYDVNVDLLTRQLVAQRELDVSFAEESNDLIRLSVPFLDAVAASTTSNITLTGLQTVDGVALSGGDRVLVKDQSNPADNGIYVVSSGSWSRAPDALKPYSMLFTSGGATYEGDAFVLTSTVTTIGVDPVTWTEFAGSGNGGTTEVQLAKRIDETMDGLTIYIGEAQPGTADTTAAWRIKRITFIGPEDTDLNIEWAAGASDFVHSWSNRLSLLYS